MSDYRISLDGAWDFQVDSGDGLDASQIREWRSAVVPMPWQAQFEDLRQTSGVAWYRRHFMVAPGLLGSTAAGAAVLHFGAVDYQATVWLNGKRGRRARGRLPALRVRRHRPVARGRLTSCWCGWSTPPMIATCTRISRSARSRTANRAGTGPSAASGRACGWNCGPGCTSPSLGLRPRRVTQPSRSRSR